ncbi:hypothetical protein AMTRI_Chr11g102280 [Amborella trichopoda]
MGPLTISHMLGMFTIQSFKGPINFENVFLVHNFEGNLISMSQLTRENHVFFVFTHDCVLLKDQLSWITFASGSQCGGFNIVDDESKKF